LKEDALLAILVALVLILLYITFRFQWRQGVSAILTLVHDVLVVVAVFSLLDKEFTLPVVAALLTVVGYSLNDTIVVFDRIREVRGKNPSLTVEMVNLSLNQTLSRTLLTSLTTFIVVAILYFGGGDGIHGFAYCLVLGVVVGTYSSIFVASPTLLWMMNPDSLFNRLVGSVSGTSKAPSRQSPATQP
jgi:preprotein translocase SecF subunit